MVDPNPIAGLYPQPPQQQPQNGLAQMNPGQVIGMVGQARALQTQGAVGNALRGAIDENGNFDPSNALSTLKTDPNAAYVGAGDIGSLLDARSKNIANSTAQFNLQSGQNDYVMNKIGALAQNPKATKADAADLVANLVRNGVAPQVAQAWYAGLSSDPKVFRQQIGNTSAAAMGAAAAAGRVQAAPDATGAPQQTTVGAAGYGNPTTPVGTAPGVDEALAAPQTEYVKDQAMSSKIMANVRPLQQVLPLIQSLSNSNFGPGSAEFAKIKGALTTADIIDPNTSDLQVRQEANKYLLRYAAGAQAAGRSDEALSAAIGANPNLDLTQPANLNLIKNQIAMDRQEALMPESFRQQNPDIASNPAKVQGYLNHKAQFFQGSDPRALRFDMMSPQERADLQKSLGPKDGPAYQRFIKTYNAAKAAGILQPPQGQGQ